MNSPVGIEYCPTRRMTHLLNEVLNDFNPRDLGSEFYFRFRSGLNWLWVTNELGATKTLPPPTKAHDLVVECVHHVHGVVAEGHTLLVPSGGTVTLATPKEVVSFS